MDILLGNSGDIKLDKSGDIVLTDSIRQSVLIRIRWILGEWRFGPDYGFPWFEDVLVKNPNTIAIQAQIKQTVLSVEGVTACNVENMQIDRETRRAKLRFSFSVGEETFQEEVDLIG